MSQQPQETNIKVWIGSAAYQQKKEQLNRELNSENVLIIDRACFQKTRYEWEKLKIAKKAYKEMVKKEIESGIREK